MSAPEQIEFIEVMRALLDVDNPFPARFLPRLSDLEGAELEFLKETWPKIPLWRRRALIEDIEEICKDDYLVTYESLGVFAAEDADSLVRLHAVRTLWEFENKSLIPTSVRLLRDDPDVDVRAASASALGQYVYLGELDELPLDILQQIEVLLLDTTQGNEEEAIRRAALESLGFSSRVEVSALIAAAFNSGEMGWKTSALFAMGRSRNEIWKNQVQSMLDNSQPDLRLEAVRAAGEYYLAGVGTGGPAARIRLAAHAGRHRWHQAPVKNGLNANLAPRSGHPPPTPSRRPGRAHRPSGKEYRPWPTRFPRMWCLFLPVQANR